MIDVHPSGTRDGDRTMPRGRALRRILLGFVRRLLVAMHESRRRQAEAVLRQHGVVVQPDWASPPVDAAAPRAGVVAPKPRRAADLVRGAPRERLTPAS